MSDPSSDNCPNCNTVFAAESSACAKCGRKREISGTVEPETDRAAIHAQTLARYRQHRDTIRAVKILAECCPACDLDGNREFALDAVPVLPHPYCTNPRGCRCCYVAVMHGAEQTLELPASSLMVSPPLAAENQAPAQDHPGFLQAPMTPLAAVLGACVVILFLGFSVVKNMPGAETTRSRTTVAPLRTLPARTASVPGVSRHSPLPKQISAADRARDRQIEATAARDLAQAEAIARANAEALQANAMAVQQQAYLKSIFSQLQARPSAMQADRRVSMADTASAATVQ